MEIVRYKRDVWGDEVILGVAWDLLWVVAVAILILLAGHAIVMAALAKKRAKPTVPKSIVMMPLTGPFTGLWPPLCWF